MEIRLDPPHHDEVPHLTVERTSVRIDVDVPIEVHNVGAFSVDGVRACGQAQITFGDPAIGVATLHVTGTADAIRAIGSIWPDIAIEIERQHADAQPVDAA